MTKKLLLEYLEEDILEEFEVLNKDFRIKFKRENMNEWLSYVLLDSGESRIRIIKTVREVREYITPLVSNDVIDIKVAKITKEGDWLIDECENRSSIHYFGSEVEARKALRSLKYCSFCVNCQDCVSCAHCESCIGVQGGYNNKNIC